MLLSTPYSTTEIYTLSLHDALPFSHHARRLRGLELPRAQHRRAGRPHAGAPAIRAPVVRLDARPAERVRRRAAPLRPSGARSEEHTSELQSPCNLVCRIQLEKTQHP